MSEIVPSLGLYVYAFNTMCIFCKCMPLGGLRKKHVLCNGVIHAMSSKVVDFREIESAYATCILVLSCPVSKLLQFMHKKQPLFPTSHPYLTWNLKM